jgi:TonB family protein
MSCNDVSSVLDTHRASLLKPAERARIDAHLATCGDCAAAWHAQGELLALRVPPVPSTLLERALLASRLPQSAPARRARMPLVVGAALLTGAAAAAVTMSVLRDESAAPTLSSPQVEQTAAPETPDATVDEPAAQVGGARAAPQGDGATSVELVETALSIAPLVRRPPDYPPEALKQGLEGNVTLSFDVTAAGFVENVSVVDSSDAQFEEPAVRALSQWRYLPRIVAGKRVAATDQRTRIVWQLNSDKDPPTDSQREADAKQEAYMREFVAFSADLEIALDRLADDDLRGSELQLDQMQAVYGAGRPDLLSFYGYLFTVQGNYDRSIEAYERSVSAYEKLGQGKSGPWAPLANLYFARHQYDLALNTLVRQRTLYNSARINNEDGVKALIAKLRALGLTHPSLEE